MTPPTLPQSRQGRVRHRRLDVASRQLGSRSVSALVNVYALIRQMRILSGLVVVERAEAVVRAIVETFFARTRRFSNSAS
jgi:hypothetical protein